MRHGRWSLVLAFVLSVGLDVGSAADDELEQTDETTSDPEPPQGPVVPITLLPVPKISLAQPRLATDAEAKEIRELIRALEKIEELGFGLGYSFIYGGAGFAPISADGDIVEPHPAFKKLVEYGPKAIPFLLEALDDDSPLGLTLTFPPTGDRRNSDLPRNAANASEVAAASRVEQANKGRPSSYTVKIGDICFVVLGQIVNRGYCAVTLEPAGFAVNSPVENKSLAKSVRDIWSDTDHAEKHFQSLLIDFCTRGDYMRLQSGAAKRLAFFFLEETSALIADTLNRLDVTANEFGFANGLDAAGLIGEVSWSSDPRIAAAVLGIFNKKPNENITLACVPGIGKQYDEVIFDRLVAFLNEQGRVENIDVGHLPCLLIVGERFPDRAKEVFEKYIEVNSTERFCDLCYVLRQKCGRFSIDLLSGLLDNHTDTLGGFQAASENAVFVNYRICDLAAETIARNFPTLKFKATGNRKDFDQQIEEMKRKIAETKIGDLSGVGSTEELGKDLADPPPDVAITIQKVPIPVPEIKLARPLKTTDAEAKEIKALIDSLKRMEDVNAGLGFGIFEAAPFPPIPLAQYARGYGVLPDPTVKKLVEYGPKAVPFLLEALDDSSPTKLTFQTTDCRRSNDLPWNPVNLSEVATAKQVIARPKDERHRSSLIAKVGDICFVVLGQIVNRCYSAFATDRHAVLVVNSPVENKALTRAIREIWSGSNPAEKFFQSLLIDFHTRGFDRRDFVIVGPNDSVEFQKGAAMRLAFYFPEEASQLVADRLKDLDPTNDIANGINAVEFVSAVSWSSDPRITAEVLRVFTETANEQLFLACCPGIGKQHDDTVFQRAVEFLERQPLGEDDAGCLELIGERFPNRAKSFFKEYLEVNSTERRKSLCYALTETRGELSIDLLSPLLSDKTETRDGHGSGGENPVFVNYRICDLAAEAISTNCPDLYFGPSESYEVMDRQIDEMKRKIADMKKGEK